MDTSTISLIAEGARVAYEDMANPRREGRVVEVVERGGLTPSGLPLPTGREYRVAWDGGGETVSDLRQRGWALLAEMPGNPSDGGERRDAGGSPRAADEPGFDAYQHSYPAGSRDSAALACAGCGHARDVHTSDGPGDCLHRDGGSFACSCDGFEFPEGWDER